MKSNRGRSKNKIVINTSACKYVIIKRIAKQYLGWDVNRNEDDDQFDVWWTDSVVPPEKLSSLKSYQKINHFSGTYVIARKNNLAYNLNRMQRAYQNQYNFFPKTWTLPADLSDFRAQFGRKKKTFIIKPEASCQGKGIFLIQKFEDLEQGERYVAQEYLINPLLIDDLKFDLRVYVLLAGIDPMRIYIHEQGLARFATEEYVKPNKNNIDDMCMHLTNYAINKNSSKFIYNDDSQDEDSGHKWTLTALMEYLEEEGFDTEKLWAEISDIAIKTLCTAQPSISHTYRSCQPNDTTNSMCFEILGFDILLDSKCKPWLLEVNQTPSFNIDSPLDEKVKTEVIMDAFNIMNIKAKHRNQLLKKIKTDTLQRTLTGVSQRLTPEQKAEQIRLFDLKRDQNEIDQLGGYTKIYPCEDQKQMELYKTFIETGWKHWQYITGANINRVKKQENTDTFEHKFQEKWRKQQEHRATQRESASSQQSHTEVKQPRRITSNIEIRRKNNPTKAAEIEDKQSVFDRLSKPRKVNQQQFIRIPANIQLDPNFFVNNPMGMWRNESAREEQLPTIQQKQQLTDQILLCKIEKIRTNQQKKNPPLSRLSEHMVYQTRNGRFVGSRTFKFS